MRIRKDKTMKLSKIINGIEIAHSDIEDLEIDYVSTDIEKIKERTLFVLENSKKAPCFSSLTEVPSAVKAYIAFSPHLRTRICAVRSRHFASPFLSCAL